MNIKSFKTEKWVFYYKVLLCFTPFLAFTLRAASLDRCTPLLRVPLRAPM